jgi:hypothetical protein
MSKQSWSKQSMSKQSRSKPSMFKQSVLMPKPKSTYQGISEAEYV